MTQRSMILIAPRFSEATQISREIGLEMWDQFEKMGVNVLPIGHYRVRPTYFLWRLNQLDRLDPGPRLCIYIGHGEYAEHESTRNSLTGGELLGTRNSAFTLLNQQDSIRNQLLVNKLTSKPTILVAIGCKTEELGKYLVNKGLRTFIGTPENTLVNRFTQVDRGKPDIAYIYATLARALIEGAMPSGAVKIMNAVADILEHHAKQFTASDTAFQEISDIYESPKTYQVYGEDTPWQN